MTPGVVLNAAGRLVRSEGGLLDSAEAFSFEERAAFVGVANAKRTGSEAHLPTLGIRTRVTPSGTWYYVAAERWVKKHAD